MTPTVETTKSIIRIKSYYKEGEVILHINICRWSPKVRKSHNLSFFLWEQAGSIYLPLKCRKIFKAKENKNKKTKNKKQNKTCQPVKN